MPAPAAAHWAASLRGEPAGTDPGAAVPTLSAVGVDDHRLADIGHADRGQDIVGRTAVDAHSDDLGDPGRHRERVGPGLPGAGLRPVDGVAEPGRHADRANQVDQRLGLVDIGHGFQGEQVRAGTGQDLQPGPMPPGQSLDGQAITSAIFGPVRQGRAVRTHRGGDPEVSRARFVTRGPGEFDAAAQQCGGAASVDSAGSKSVERCLVAGRRRDLGPGAKVCGVHRDDLPRRVGEQPGRPQRVGEAVTARLEFGGQAAIADQHGFTGSRETDSQSHPAHCRVVAAHQPRSDNDRDTPKTRIARLGE